MRGSDWGADQKVVRMFVNTAPKAVRELAAWGVPWSRVQKGDRDVIINAAKVTITERDEAHGLVAQRDFGGTKKWRTCYVSDGTGHAMLYAVSDQAIAHAIPVHERMEALALIHDAGRCYGAIVRNLVTGELVAYVAKATAIASGGAGRLYRATTNAVICEGIGTALALETGVATVGNMEAIQFHPDRHFPGRHPGHRGVPRRRRTAARRRRASGSCRTTSRRRRSSHRATSSPAAWKNTFMRGKGVQVALRRASLAGHHAARRGAHQSQSARGEGDLRLLPRHRPDQGLDPGAARAALHDGRRAHQSHRREPDAAKACLPRAKRRAGTCTASTDWAAIRSPKRSSAGMIVGEFIADFCDRPENRRAAFDRTDPRVPVTASRPSSTRSSTATATRRRTRSAARCRTS